MDWIPQPKDVEWLERRGKKKKRAYNRLTLTLKTFVGSKWRDEEKIHHESGNQKKAR